MAISPTVGLSEASGDPQSIPKGPNSHVFFFYFVYKTETYFS